MHGIRWGETLDPFAYDYSAAQAADLAGWNRNQGGVVYLTEEDGLGKKKGLLKRLKRHLNPVTEAKSQLKFMGKLAKALPPLSPKRQLKLLTHPKQAWHRSERLARLITPKPIRKVVNKKNLIKYGPYLAAVAQVLNLIVPGLGIAVGLAITAGVTAAKIQQSKKQIHKLKEADKAADQKAVAAYDMSQGYLEEKYNMPREKFVRMSTDDKINFLANAVEDAKHENSASGKLEAAGAVGWGIGAAGLLALFIL